MAKLVKEVFTTALCCPHFIFSAVHFEFLKKSSGNPLGTFFHTLALAIRTGEEEKEDNSERSLMSSEQIKAEKEIRAIFSSNQVIAMHVNQNLHITLREEVNLEKPFDEDCWKSLNSVLKINKGAAFKTKIRELDKFFYLYEFVFPAEDGTAEQMILYMPDHETEITCSLLFLVSCAVLLFAYCLGGFFLLLAAAIAIYSTYIHLHKILPCCPLLKNRTVISSFLLVLAVAMFICFNFTVVFHPKGLEAN